MKSKKFTILVFVLLISVWSCNNKTQTDSEQSDCYYPTLAAASETMHPAWSNDATIYEVNIRQYTPEGTFKAFEQHLPRLQELGVEILWFMPIHPISEKNRKGTLGSYYAVADYKAVNPEFGTIDDFKNLVDKAHQMGFKVLLDWVANHTGWDHHWIKEHPEWYSTDSTGNIIPPVPDWSDVADLNYDVPEMRAAMTDALKFWVAEADIDGYRCDVAGEVPTDFWNEARAELDQIKPVYMLAEDEGNKELLNKAFNVNYGWSFHHLMNEIAKGEKEADEIMAYFAAADSSYPSRSYMMQFTSNHDENSWNGTAYERMGEAVQAMAALSFVVPGMPLIYSGQEAGLNKRLEFFEKDEIDWSQLPLQDFYAQLIDVKQNNQALWNGCAGGPLTFYPMTEKNNLLVFSRKAANNMVVAIFNLSDEKQSNMVATLAVDGTYKNALTDNEMVLNNQTMLELEPWQFMILIRK
jgi:glycosidase